MTNSGPKTKVDLDLDALQPATRTMRFKGVVYRLPGELPIPIANRALQMSEKMREEDEGDPSSGIEMLNEMQGLVMDILRMENDNVPDELPWGMDSLSRVLGMVITGDPNVTLEQAAIQTINPPGYEDKGEDTEGGKSPTKASGAKTRAKGSRSRKPSPAHSSS